MGAPVRYMPDLCVTAGSPDLMFEVLASELTWERRTDAPRDEYYSNDTDAPYTYGRGEHARTYQPQPWHPVMLSIRDALETDLGCVLDVCFLNRYHGPRDWLGWHSDDSPEMDPARPIVTVSLGAERPIQFRTAATEDAPAGPVETLMLGHGSGAVMAAGMQQVWQHRIPKVGHDVGPRISLTFRGYISS